MLRKTLVACAVIVFALLCCVKKQTWQGSYTTVSYTTTAPKEDFKVGGYIVVAYDLREGKRSGVVYRFDVMQMGDKIGALEVCDRSISMLQASPEYQYYLLAGETETARGYASGPGLAVPTRQIHRMYKDVPNYSVVKQDIIDVLSEY